MTYEMQHLSRSLNFIESAGAGKTCSGVFISPATTCLNRLVRCICVLCP